MTVNSRGWVAAPYQTTRDKIDLYLTNDASNLSYKRENRKIYSKISQVKSGLCFLISNCVTEVLIGRAIDWVMMSETPNMPLLQKVKVEDKNDVDQEMVEKEHNTETLVEDQAADRS